MTEYSSTREGFQRSMKWSLTGPPEETKVYAEATAMPTFYHIMNGKRTDYDDYVKFVAEWRGKTSDYEPKLEEFLRDGNQLAARMTGTIKIEGAETAFESFMFAEVDKESGRLLWLIERGVWGPVGAEMEHGVH